MEPETEYRYCSVEVRATSEGKVISGTVMRYADTARIGPRVQERFEPGAFGPDVSQLDVVVNQQHNRQEPIGRTDGGGLTLTDSATELRAELTPAPTQAGQDALRLVEARVLRGFSVEFHVLPGGEEFRGNERIIRKAKLTGLGLVAQPAYGKSLATVEARMEEAAELEKAKVHKPLRRIF